MASRVWPRQAPLRSHDVQAALEMEDFAHVDTRRDERGARGFDVGDDQKVTLNRARQGGGEPLAEQDGTGRPGRRQLQRSPVTAAEVGVQAPSQALVET